MSEWIEWSGGVCPVPDGTLVDVEYRDGSSEHSAIATSSSSSGSGASPTFWENDHTQLDIIRYRVCQSVSRESKRSDFNNWFDTWDEAHSFLMKHAQLTVDNLRKNLEGANGALGRIKGMPAPMWEVCDGARY